MKRLYIILIGCLFVLSPQHLNAEEINHDKSVKELEESRAKYLDNLNKRSDARMGKYKKIIELRHEQAMLIIHADENPSKYPAEKIVMQSYEQAAEAVDLAHDAFKDCDIFPDRYLEMKLSCYDTTIIYANKAAEMMLGAADYAAKNGYKKKATEIYRQIIISFPNNDVYRNYIKRAEFALEDLKEK